MSKPRRRVTVDTGKPVSEESEKRKPSVFERLGPGGGQRKYEERGEKSKSQSQSLYLDKCRHWLLTGNCPFGAKCKFQHGPFIAKRPTKNRSDDDGAEDLRLKVKGSTERHHPEGSVSPESRSGSRSRHDKETKIKSTVVVKNTTGGDSGDEDSENSDNWDAEVLDYKKELELEKKRQEIQRALSQLAASEGEERENITIEKKVPSKEKIARESVSFTLKKNRPQPTKPFSSDYSDSDSSPERTKAFPEKSPKKTSPPSKKKGDKKKHKQKSPFGKAKGPLRTPSPSEMGKHKEHKKKYDTEDDSPHKTKHKKMKKMDKKLDRSPEPDLPKSKKKHSPRIDKFHSEKPSKADKRLLSPDLGSPTGKRSHRSWSPTSRSRSRSITPIPPKKQKNISPGLVKEKVKGEKVKQKKKKGKGKLGGDGSAARERHISPVRIKKKKIKAELPFPIKRDIEEDLPARHSDSPGSENMPPRSVSPGSPRRKEPLEREFFKGMLHDREEEKRETGSRKSKRKRSETPPQRERIPPSRSDLGDKRKGGQSQERKFSRKEQYNADIDRPKHSDERGRRASPDSFRSEDRSPTPTPPSRRNHSPDGSQRSRSRRGRDEDIDVNRSRDRRSPDERRMGKESRDRREDLDPRGQSRENYRERYEHGEEHRRDPRERFDEGFPEFSDRYQDRSRFQEDREQFDPRERHRHEPSFERGRENRRERYEGRDRLVADQGRMHPGQGRDYFGDRHQQGMHGMGRGAGRGRGAYEGGMRERSYAPDRQEQMRGYPAEFADRQSRRSEWEDRRRGEVFGQGREWGDRHDMSHEERFDMRRDDHRFDERYFRRDDERQIGRDGRPLSRSIDRNMRDGWRDRPDMREDRVGLRDERMRENRMDDRRRERHSPSPFDKRGYRDDRFPHDERLFGREDDDRMREERIPMERGRDDRIREDRGPGERDRDVRGGMDRGRDDRGMMERDRGPMDRGRDGSVDERGRGNRGRDDRGREDRMGMDRGREERGPLDRMKEDRGSLDRGEDRGFMDERRRERGFREDRKGERGPRDERGFREEEDRFRDDRGFRDDNRGGKFERDFREERVGRDERHRDEREFRGSHGDPSPEDDRTPDQRTREEKEDQEKASRDGSHERPRSSSSKSERTKDKISKDDRNSDKSSKDSRMSKDEKSSKDDRSKERGERRKREDRSPRRDGKKEEKGKWPPPDGEEQDSEAESGEDLKQEETRSRDSRKRGPDKEELPLSPIPKRLREVSPASSSRSRGSHNSRRLPDRDQQRSRRRGDSGSDREDKSGRKGSVDRDKKSRKKDATSIDASSKSEKSRSISPKPSKEKNDDKADKGKARRRSLSGSSSKSKEGVAPPEAEEKKPQPPPAAPRKADDNLYDEDNISAIVSLGGKSSLADDDRASDHASIRSVPFSDWSEDDMADNILNQAEIEREERRQRSPSRSSLGSRGSALDRKIHVSQDHMLEVIKERVHGESGSMVSCEGEEGGPGVGQDKDRQFDDEMDALPEYEQISSDEDGFMEDDGEVQSSIVNILDIDWSSLKDAAKPKPKGSALQRFSPASIFSQIGVSRAYAGDELFEKIKTVCQKQLDESEKTENDGADGNKEKTSQKFVLHDSVAAFHCAALRKLRERASLLKNIGSHRRALCARKDLEIRRRLCKVDKVFDQSPVYPSHVMDTDLSKLSVQLFRQGRDITPDKKGPEAEAHTEVSCST